MEIQRGLAIIFFFNGGNYDKQFHNRAINKNDI